MIKVLKPVKLLIIWQKIVIYSNFHMLVNALFIEKITKLCANELDGSRVGDLLSGQEIPQEWNLTDYDLNVRVCDVTALVTV